MAYYREKKKHTKKPNSVIFSYPRFVNTWAFETKNPDKAVFKCFGLTAVVVKCSYIPFYGHKDFI